MGERPDQRTTPAATNGRESGTPRWGGSTPRLPQTHPTIPTGDADPYQERYLKHQRRKAKVLAQLLSERHSDRVFSDRPVTDDDLSYVVAAGSSAPSSCARHGVTMMVTRDRDHKALLGGLLVGGVGWIHRAPAVIILHADPQAYKAPGELGWMPFLDAGVMVGQMGLAVAARGMVGCFVNPNVRERDRDHFALVFGTGVLCGAYAIGWPRWQLPPWVGDTS